MLKSQNEYIADILHPERRGSHPDVGVGGGQRGFAPVNDHDNLPLGNFKYSAICNQLSQLTVYPRNYR